jgi:D-glycero-alpha-D-manno-heptose 1-phosphate guanylyltransferase
MIIAEAIILAGGLGTRLKSAVPDLPKCMAPVAGRPFIDFVIKELLDQNISKIIFSLGYLHEIVLQHLNKNWPSLDYDYCIESTPLGTGGAIRLASQKVLGDHFLVVNGDTLFKVDLNAMFLQHLKLKAFITLALKPMKNFDRYGSVVLNEKTIISFKEKTFINNGLINGGSYVIEKTRFQKLALSEVFSFEKDVLEPAVATGLLKGFISDDYFIDIGIPEDFQQASYDLQNIF